MTTRDGVDNPLGRSEIKRPDKRWNTLPGSIRFIKLKTKAELTRVTGSFMSTRSMMPRVLKINKNLFPKLENKWYICNIN